jgi:phosphoadenosine phosphosulfate reductase
MSTRALEAMLESIAAQYSPAVLASSLQAESMVIIDSIARLRLAISVFMIDTGRLHGDTHALIPRIRLRYGIQIETYQPQAAAVANYVQFHGRDALYRSLDLRRKCCEIRKVEPLARALAGKRAWITGQRREQGSTRVGLPEHEFDAAHGLEKFNPLAAWTEAAVWDYIRSHDVPYNRLYDQGYRSIGCAPCTRAVLPNEDVRAGRWWWEEGEAKECGLHATADGRLTRRKAAA